MTEPHNQPQEQPESDNAANSRMADAALAAAKAGGIVVLFGEFRGRERRVVVRREPTGKPAAPKDKPAAPANPPPDNPPENPPQK